MIFGQPKAPATNQNLFGTSNNLFSSSPTPTKNVEKPFEALPKISIMDFQKTDYKSSDRKLYSEMPFSDVKFEVGEKQFPAHRCILFTRCPEFSAQHLSLLSVEFYITDFSLDQEGQEKDAPIKLSDIDSPTFEVLLEYIYCGDDLTLKDENTAINLLKAAQKYSLPILRGLCEKYLIGKMTAENIIQMINVSEECKAEKLTDYALTFIYDNFEAVFERGINQPSDLSNTLLLKLFKKKK